MRMLGLCMVSFKGCVAISGTSSPLGSLMQEVTPLVVADTGATHGFCVRHLWRFSHRSLLFGKQVLFGFLKCSGKLCSSPAVVVELAFCEF
jgi:hypothetical protein